ncbi:chalcone isomerase family protein [Burkholderia cenocepacia]|uniref:chalcone isomerase family protein n=1 Tax=Burkholderia cenocepacia TaxID=95486 RepID=UPI0023B92B58|nr:chalcone isomerase family protein [Burkholderia cenocepacia]MDF0506683.1 chalcone isomerase family protein [Burkholderia cenocepacia]
MYAVRRAAILALAPALSATPQTGARCFEDVPSARMIGAGQFCVFGVCLYDAKLWAPRLPTGFDTPFALPLTYRHDVSGARLTAAGMAAIERLARAPLPAATRDAWRADIARAFTAVARGDVLCGVYLPDQGAHLYANGRLTADIADPIFARTCFDIWLDPRTRAGSLHRQLLGG